MYLNVREEALKLKIAQNVFGQFDCTNILGNIDFSVCLPKTKTAVEETPFLAWGEAKQGKSDIINSFIQLILTIGKARTFDKYLPPAFLCAFDGEKIAFVPYSEVHDVFYMNDFNWNVTPSNHKSKEFKLLHARLENILEEQALLYFFGVHDGELREFIATNFVADKIGITKTRIDKNNFVNIYNKWLQSVMPSIDAYWDEAKKVGIIDGDFYLADLLSSENQSLKEKLFVLLKGDKYEFDRKYNSARFFSASSVGFNDNQRAHTQFWNKYERPPLQEYWDYIIARRDLLVPQDVRERKGSFFTPRIWVERSQQYLADALGADWQDEYYIWDCAAGTGNLLLGLTNKYNIYASTLDQQDVDVMHDRIANGAKLLKDHVFQFDFLNDSFDKLPDSLKEIINDPEKRKKLVIYINPPYAEHTNKENLTQASFKDNLAQNLIHRKYGLALGKAKMELFAQFFARVQREMRGSVLAKFSTLKILQAPNFKNFRLNFPSKLLKIFVVPADTFDNVTGQFPIGFHIWDTSQAEVFEKVDADIYDKKGTYQGIRTIRVEGEVYINDWLKQFRGVNANEKIGILHYRGNDFQHQGMVFIENTGQSSMTQLNLNMDNLIPACVYFAVRHAIPAKWLNDRDQFLYPNNTWKTDIEFHNDCLAFTLFYSQNKIEAKEGANHWIPFSEEEVDAKTRFASNFMWRYLQGKEQAAQSADLFAEATDGKKATAKPLEFSAAAMAVFAAGRALWSYYHAQPKANANAALYDIREHFQGRNAQGRMNSRSEDETYTALLRELRLQLRLLAKKIEKGVYKHGFLK